MNNTNTDRNYKGIFYAYLGIILASYLAFFLSPDLPRLGVPAIINIVGLGIIHFILIAYVYEHFIGRRPINYLFIYFIIQLVLISLIILLSQGIGNLFWLLLLPIAGQSLDLPRWGTLLVCMAIPLLLGGLLLYAGSTWVFAQQVVLSISTAVLFVLIFTHIADREWVARLEVERLARELQEANQQLRHYAGQVEEMATIQERNRIAREIHDSLGHYLTTINMQLNAAQAILKKEPVRAQDALGKAQRLTQDGLQEVRHSVAALRESAAEKRPFLTNIDQLIEESQRSGLVVERHIAGQPFALDLKIERSLYRAVQEGLTNTRKHGRASRIEIKLDYSQPQQIQLVIQDNGVGSDPPVTNGSGFGLLGLRERIQLLGGQMQVDTAPQAGFRLNIVIPL